jgi:hypothetical protein
MSTPHIYINMNSLSVQQFGKIKEFVLYFFFNKSGGNPRKRGIFELKI